MVCPNDHHEETPTTRNTNGLQPSSQPACIPIVPKFEHLPSKEIDTTGLIDPHIIIAKYPQFHNEKRARTLARKLAERSYFGDRVLQQCTVAGSRSQPGLPLKELDDLKAKIFSLFPDKWGNPLSFEQIWKTCTVSIGEVCKGLRIKEKK